MDTPKNFRSAFNGFNREDVVRCIEYMNAQHVAQINELNGELEFLRGKLATPAEIDPAIQKRLDDYKEQVRILESRCDTLEQERDAATNTGKDTALEAKIRELEARCEALAHERDAAVAAKEAAVAVQACAELEAYRRAERTERVAQERAEKVYHQVNGVLSDATVKVDEAASQIGDMSEQFLARLDALRSAVDSSRQALAEAASTMYALRPQSEE
jgi:chromosome segregation ATPase